MDLSTNCKVVKRGLQCRHISLEYDRNIKYENTQTCKRGTRRRRQAVNLNYYLPIVTDNKLTCDTHIHLPRKVITQETYIPARREHKLSTAAHLKHGWGVGTYIYITYI